MAISLEQDCTSSKTGYTASNGRRTMVGFGSVRKRIKAAYKKVHFLYSTTNHWRRTFSRNADINSRTDFTQWRHLNSNYQTNLLCSDRCRVDVMSNETLCSALTILTNFCWCYVNWNTVGDRDRLLSSYFPLNFYIWLLLQEIFWNMGFFYPYLISTLFGIFDFKANVQKSETLNIFGYIFDKYFKI